jgi:DNA-binding CsgD family transcriptional regulator
MPPSATEQEILNVLRAEWVAFFGRDFKTLASHWLHGPEVRRTLSGPHCRTIAIAGWEELAKRLQQGMQMFPQACDPAEWLQWEKLQIIAGSDMAWVSYDQVATRHNDGILASGLQHETKILHRVDGKWKLVGLFIVVPGLGRDDTPLIELDHRGQVLRVNALAHECLLEHQGLAVSNGRVRARNRMFEAHLRQEIGRAGELMSATLPPGYWVQSAAQAVPLGEDDLGRPLHCWITIEQERMVLTFDDAHLMSRRLDLAAELFALSPAQRNLAGLMAGGDDLGASAARLGVSVNTVRTQLRRMFDKTATHNQAALVSRLLGIQRPG